MRPHSRWPRPKARFASPSTAKSTTTAHCGDELEAKGCVFRSQSDTEVLLHLYADRGAADGAIALRGMYAFGIFDARAQELFLARDPFGIKPLYYADDGATLRFATLVEALIEGGRVDTRRRLAGIGGVSALGPCA